MTNEMKKLTPLLVVDAIEPCLEFWTGLGFQKTVEVRERERLGFVILVKDEVEVMYQTRESLGKDAPALADTPFTSALYIEVTNLNDVLAASGQAPVVVARRQTFYGADEIFVREPGGNVIAFSEQSGGAAPQ